MSEKILKEQTGYPSIDKPWLKYYSKEVISTPLQDYMQQFCYEFMEELTLTGTGKVDYKTL